jgi:hypothetical protein
VFEWISEQLETATGWSRLASRGTVRLALKEMGLDPRTVTKQEMLTSLRTTLARKLDAHRVYEAERLCRRMAHELGTAAFSSSIDSPEAIFSRLGRT